MSPAVQCASAAQCESALLPEQNFNHRGAVIDLSHISFTKTIV